MEEEKVTLEQETAEEAAKNTANTEKKDKKPSRAPMIVLSFLCMAMLAAIIVLLCFTINITKANSKSIKELKSTDGDSVKIDKLTKEVESLNSTIEKLMEMAGGEDVAQEDDVNIAGGYRILSTKEISDAYISGDTSKLNDDQKKCLELADAVLKKVVKEGMTDYEKELAVYTWIRDNIKHDEGVTVLIPDPTKSVDTPLGVLSGKKAVCVGYATTFRLLMQMQGIDCKVVHDTSLVHSWDEVKLDDGWYMVDIYSDAETQSFANFNMNGEMAAAGHEWNTEFFPEANGSKYIYARMTAKEYKEIKDYIKDCRAAMESKNGGTVYAMYKGANSANDAALAHEVSSYVSNYADSSELCDKGYCDYEIYKLSDEEYIVSFSYVVWNDSEDEPELPGEVDQDKLESAINDIEDVFGDFYDKHTHNEYDDSEYDEYEFKNPTYNRAKG